MGRRKKSLWVQRMARSMGIETEDKTDEELLRMIGGRMDLELMEDDPAGIGPDPSLPPQVEEEDVLVELEEDFFEEVEVLEGGEEVEEEGGEGKKEEAKSE